MPDTAEGVAPATTRADWQTDQEVRWCPGCGDYSILTAMQLLMPDLDVLREDTVFISGIGCAARFPYYMNTYGFHTIHGRAPALATGVKLANPDLDVWVVTGDGDGLSIGGNHLMHILRRNVNVKILLFNNRIYGLTKGQYSPTSPEGKKTPSTPMGSIDLPLSPLSMALASESSFVARCIDVDRNLAEVLERAAAHKGAAFVEIYQDCNVFNHKAFEYATGKDTKEDHIVRLENGKPLIFGTERNKGVRLRGDQKLEVVDLGKGIGEDDLLFHDEEDESLAFLLSRMTHPEFPEPMGVFYFMKDDCYEQLMSRQVEAARATHGDLDLEDLLNSGDTYTVDGTR